MQFLTKLNSREDDGTEGAQPQRQKDNVRFESTIGSCQHPRVASAEKSGNWAKLKNIHLISYNLQTFRLPDLLAKCKT